MSSTNIIAVDHKYVRNINTKFSKKGTYLMLFNRCTMMIPPNNHKLIVKCLFYYEDYGPFPEVYWKQQNDILL